MNVSNESYADLQSRCRSLIDTEAEPVSSVANIIAEVHHTMKFLWTGIYLTRRNDMYLSVFQGPVACTRIPFGKGVCGTAWQMDRAIYVEDVETFPGHIRCSSMAVSEIVVPLHRNGMVVGVLDVDSAIKGQLSESDLDGLTRIAEIIESLV